MALKNDSKEHRFGGDWTETKLAILQKYLAAYTTALKRTSFRKAYIDAFAGTGYPFMMVNGSRRVTRSSSRTKASSMTHRSRIILISS